MQNNEENQYNDAKEVVVIYDQDGKKIRTGYKGTILADDEFLKCCTCFVMDKNDNVIMQVRSKNKLKEPGKLDLCSGHVKENEVYTQAMLRELEEENGILYEELINALTTGKMQRLGNLKMKFENWKCLVDIYVLFRDKEGIEDLHFQKSEIDDILVVPYNESIEMIRRNETRFLYTKEYELCFQQLEEKIKHKQQDRNIKGELSL